MSRYTTRVAIWLGTFACALISAGCATGSKFTPEATVPDGKALIYVYRQLNVGGIASKHIIYANSVPVAVFANASYYPFVTSPGTIIFSSQSLTISPIIDVANSRNNILMMEAESGKTYYAEFHIGDTFGPKMVLVNPEIGLKRIQKCRLATSFEKHE